MHRRHLCQAAPLLCPAVAALTAGVDSKSPATLLPTDYPRAKRRRTTAIAQAGYSLTALPLPPIFSACRRLSSPVLSPSSSFPSCHGRIRLAKPKARRHFINCSAGREFPVLQRAQALLASDAADNLRCPCSSMPRNHHHGVIYLVAKPPSLTPASAVILMLILAGAALPLSVTDGVSSSLSRALLCKMKRRRSLNCCCSTRVKGRERRNLALKSQQPREKSRSTWAGHGSTKLKERKSIGLLLNWGSKPIDQKPNFRPKPNLLPELHRKSGESDKILRRN